MTPLSKAPAYRETKITFRDRRAERLAPRSAALDSALLAILVLLLIKPLFRLEYLDNWPSIESTFIADARMLSEHLPHPGWQPLWYCGTRFDYIYPPALRYGTALLSIAGHISPARAYHIYTAFFYVFGIVSVYWLVRVASGSRASAWLASAATGLLSPSFLFLPIIRNDSFHLIPQRLHVLMLYGEGPHISALAILPAALAASWYGLRKNRPAMLALASVFCALVVANNFYGATALAIFFALEVWVVWIAERSLGVWLRAGAIALLSYGLCAFWLSPSYVKITLVDLKWVAEPGNNWSKLIAGIFIALFCGATLLLGNRRPERSWTIFVIGSASAFGLYVLGYFYAGFSVTGNSARLTPELDLTLILLFVEFVRALWTRPGLRLAAVALVAIAFYPAHEYVRHARFPFPKAAPLRDVYQYRVTQWVRDHLRGQRVLPAGSIRFWFDAWSDNEQPDGGSQQGMLNQVLPAATWQILHGDKAAPGVLWLQALGTDAMIVTDQTSPEPYRDYPEPHKFQGIVPAIYDDHSGTVIYQVPRVHPGIGRVVDNAAISAVGFLRAGDDAETLTKYVNAVEDANQPLARVTWAGFDEVHIEAEVRAGQAVLLQETFDPAWRAYEDGNRLPLRAEPFMGFMLIDVPPGLHKIHLRFETPLENRFGQAAFLASLLVMFTAISCSRKGRLQVCQRAKTPP